MAIHSSPLTGYTPARVAPGRTVFRPRTHAPSRLATEARRRPAVADVVAAVGVVAFPALLGHVVAQVALGAGGWWAAAVVGGWAVPEAIDILVDGFHPRTELPTAATPPELIARPVPVPAPSALQVSGGA
ncbi:MAG: hypothetical protein QM779_15755 [Propionicimonas sp.]|uniref:hypothetical protein n=1 Tax=Propionicimonas sp. TaxID=1955623 RepID=UPI003D0B70C7